MGCLDFTFASELPGGVLQRQATALVQVRSIGNLEIRKYTEYTSTGVKYDDTESVGKALQYVLSVANRGAQSVTNMELIEVLPYNGDSTDIQNRLPATAFNGTVAWNGATSLPAGFSIIGYTKTNPAIINQDPKCASNNTGPLWIDGNMVISSSNQQGDDWALYCDSNDTPTVWCAGLTGGTCPADNSEVTAVKFGFTGTILPNSAPQNIEFSILPQDNEEGDIYTDSFSARTPSIVLPIISNDVYWRVVEGSIGNYVWYDYNENGIQDASEPPIPNVPVMLTWYGPDNMLGGGDDVVLMTTTNASGLYTFEHLPSGTFDVKVTPPFGVVQTYDLDGLGTPNTTQVTLSETLDPTTGELVSIQDRTDVDFGYDAPGRIGDKIWRDNNQDGSITGGETFFDNITVKITFAGADGVFGTTDDTTQTTVTSMGGMYSFENLPLGKYKVEVVNPPAGFTQSFGTGGHEITLTSATRENLTADFAYWIPASLGDYVFYDANSDGIYGSTEVGVAGVTVKLLNSGGTVIETTTTNGEGYYHFNNLTAGTYSVMFVAPSGYVFTSQNIGDDNYDSDANPSTGMTGTYTLIDGETNDTVDAGLKLTSGLPASLGNFVWFDTNSNGTQDVGESGVPGVTVKLLNASSTVIATTTTDAAGAYIFEGLAPGTYSVMFVAPSGLTYTSANVGNDATDSDANTTTGMTSNITLASGENNLTVDAGLVGAVGALGDTVFLDLDADGLQDVGETGVPGVTVVLLKPDGTVLATTQTDPNGKYLFSNLPAGSYKVQFNPPAGYGYSPQDQGGNDATDSDGNGMGMTGTVTVTAGATNSTVDQGLTATTGVGCLGDLVFEDFNSNGIQDAGERPIAGVTVELRDSQGRLLSTAVTDSNGRYSFCNLVPGVYYVRIVPPSGYEVTDQAKGSDRGTDSDFNPITGNSSPIIVTAGNNNVVSGDGGIRLANPSCIGQSFAPEQTATDTAVLSISKYAAGAITARQKDKAKGCTLSRSAGNKLRTDTHNLYLSTWTCIWTKLQTINGATNNGCSCTTVDNSTALNTIKSGESQLYRKALGIVKAKCSGNTKRKLAKLKSQIEVANQTFLTQIALYPTSTLRCE